MKYIGSCLAALILLLMTLSCTPKLHRYEIFCTRTGNSISLRKLSAELTSYDMVMFGEIKGHNTIHYIQAELLPLFLKEAEDIAISMDIFSRDVQTVLDEYLLGNLSEEEFIQNSQLPHTYRFDYRPIIEFAKKEAIPVIAANVPKRIIREVNSYGTRAIDMIPVEDRFLVAEEFIMTEGSYKDNFFIVKTNSPHVTSFDKDIMDSQLENLYASQSLQDDTMAESMMKFHLRNRETKIIHFNDDLHSSRGLGVVSKLLMRKRDVRIAVISPIVVSSLRNTPELSSMRGRGDYVIVIEDPEK